MAVAATDLVDLPEVRRYLRITDTSRDRLLTQLVAAATNRIEQFCNRTLVEADHREFYDGDGSDALLLNNFPVTGVARMGWSRVEGITVTAAISTDLRVTVEAQDNQVSLRRWNSSGSLSESKLTYASNATTTAMASAIDGTIGFDATKVNDGLSEDFARQAATDCIDGTGRLYMIENTTADFRVEENRGVITLIASTDLTAFPQDPSRVVFPIGRGNVMVVYTAGYTQAAMPADLKQICIEVVAQALRSGEHDPTVGSEAIDGYSYSNIGKIQLDQEMRQRLAPWRRKPSG